MTVSRLGWKALLWAAMIPTAASAQKSNPSDRPSSASDLPHWAFPNTSAGVSAPTPPFDSTTALHVPQSTRSFTLGQVKNQLNPADWFPGAHPQAPDVVIHSRPAAKYACGYCHLPDGQGRSENATIVGLPTLYFIRQLTDLGSGARHGALAGWGPSVRMGEVAKATTREEAADAARYFGRMRAKRRYTVVERDKIPGVYEAGGLYAAKPGADSEPLDGRLMEMSNDIERHELHDPGETFTTFVPLGSIERGRRIAAAAPAKSVTRCATCHGMDLRGIALVPPIAGRSPAYLLRQLIGFKTGARATATSAPMQLVASTLELGDMIAVAAYAGSRRP